MSNTTVQINDKKIANDRQMESWHPAVPAWRIILSTELTDLWVGGKALYLILAYSVLLGIQTFVLATNFELSLFTPPEMIFETLKSVIQVSMLIGLIIGADSISGERERATLEGILLAPASRRQIVLGKFLAALSTWPAALMIATPFMFLLSQGNVVFGPAVLWGALVGILLIPAFTALGMIVSIRCNSNKTSFFVSLGIFVIFVLIGQVLGSTKIGLFGQFLQLLNPVPAAFDFISKMLGLPPTPASGANLQLSISPWSFLQSPFVFAAAIIGLLFFYFTPGLSVEAGKVSRLWLKLSRMVGMTMIACLMIFSSATPAKALPQTRSGGGDLGITISLDTKTVKTGDTIVFETVVTNNGAEQSPAVIVAMNIINLSKTGDVVDPEDWSPQRTQYIDSLAPNESITLSWTVNAVLDGNFMVYLVAIAEPKSEGESGQVIASPGLHMSVTKFTSLNPSGVLPYVIGVPIVLVLAIFLLFRYRRGQVDAGGSE